jgi:SAM-dependent methyltransferase
VSRDRYRLAFDSVADVYESSRPGYAPDAIDWLATRLPFRHVLDLGAGTGKLTRQLVAAGADVVAVEPGPEMRAVFRRALPNVDVHEGSAEAIPLPDASVDTVTAGQAFHWFETTRALAEMHRVLRPGGGFALLWNRWDEDDELMRALNDAVPRMGGHDESAHAAIEASPLFTGLEERLFPHADEVESETAVARVSSISVVAAAEPADRERTLERVRELVGPGTVTFRMITSVLVADRV